MNLLIICTNSENAFGIRQISAIQFKNFVESYWKFSSDQTLNKAMIISEQDRIIVIANEEKKLIRDQIIKVTGEFSDKSIMKLFVEAIKKILKFDFVVHWKAQFVNDIKTLFESKNESKIYCGITIFYQLAKIYEFETARNRADYEECFVQLFSYLSEFLKQVKNNIDNEIGLVILKKILKLTYRTVNSDIPAVLCENGAFEFWIMSIIEVVNNLKGEAKEQSRSSDEMLSTNYWKTGLQAFQILYRLCTKYSNPNITDSKKLKSLSLLIKDKYQTDILKVFFVILEKSVTQVFPDRIICLIFKYLAHSIGKNTNVDMIEPHLDILLSDFIIQNSILIKADLLLRVEDEKSYIYKTFDLAQSFYDRRFAVSSFLRALCEYRVYDNSKKKLNQPKFLNKIYDFITSMFAKYESEKQLNKNPDPLIKEALMHLFESVATPFLEHKQSSEIENIIKTFIVPELVEENNTNGKYKGVVKERGAFIIKVYSILKYQDFNTLKVIAEVLCKMLMDQDLSVRVITSVTLPSLMKHKEVTQFLGAYVKNLLEEYLKLMNQIDMEELLVGLESIINHFGDNVAEYAVDLTKELTKQFNRLIHINVDDDNGESHLAAEGVIKAMNRIVNVCSNKENIIKEVEIIIKPVIEFSLSGEGFEYLDEGLDIIRSIIKKTGKVSPITWSYFSFITYTIIGDEEENRKILEEYPDTALEGIGYDSIEELIGLLALYASKDIKSLVTENDSTGKKYIDRLFETLEQIIKNCSGEIDVTNSVTVCRMFSQILDAATIINKANNHKVIVIDFYMQKILDFLINTIPKTKQLTYKLGLYGAFCSCLLYDTKMTLDILFKKGQLEKYMQLWFTFLGSLKTENNTNKNVYGLTCVLSHIPSFQTDYNLNPQTFIAVLMKNISGLIEKLDKIKQRKLENKIKGIEDFDDDDNDEVDMDAEFEAKLKKVRLIINNIFFYLNRQKKIWIMEISRMMIYLMILTMLIICSLMNGLLILIVNLLLNISKKFLVELKLIMRHCIYLL